MVKQTAGRDALHDFAPKFAELNDDVLFGEVWSREGQLPLKLRSIVTITALISKGITDSSLTYHLTTAKQNGVTKTEMAEILTHLSFYAGWPNAWAAFRQAKEVYADDGADANGGLFGLGKPNTAYAQYFTGESFLNPLTDPTKTVFLANVTFPPACRNNWHIHHAKSGGGQILICVAGRGFYQEWGRAAVRRAGGARRVRRKKHFSVCKPFGTKKSGPFPDLIFYIVCSAYPFTPSWRCRTGR